LTDDDKPFVFTQSEQHLLKTLARQLSLIVEKQEADANKLELERQLRHADRLATIGQLAAGVAHELNEPLGNILGFAQLAAKADNLPEQVDQDLANIIKSSLHAREIIKKLMIFGRPMQPVQTLVNLNRLVDDSLYFLEARCVKNGIRIVKQIDSALPDIIGDQSQFRQVLVNLVINAAQAMPRGGDLVITTAHDSTHARLMIADTGVGIEKDHLKKIFLPFFTTKDVDEGTGLGLSVVHGIVSAHKGTIDVASEIGRGSVFTVTLPIESPKPDSMKDDP
jgi:two-component system NtrC family sensor kinase